MIVRRKRSSRSNRGASLLELIAASAVVAICLVGALRLMRDTMAVSSDIETADLMTTLCASKLEQALAQTASSWSTTTDAGDFSSMGYSNIRFSVTKSDSAGNGGITNRLMALTATVWQDTNSNSALDTGERRVVFSSKLAKMQLYTGT